MALRKPGFITIHMPKNWTHRLNAQVNLRRPRANQTALQINLAESQNYATYGENFPILGYLWPNVNWFCYGLV